MRKIEKQMLEAIQAGREFSKDNTRVTVNTREDGALITSVYLHGNLIAQNGVTGWGVVCAGWDTPTTRSRINAVLSLVCTVPVRMYKRRGVLMLGRGKDGLEIGASEWVFIAPEDCAQPIPRATK